MITTKHTQEQLSRAYAVAVAGVAGVNISVSENDYGVDGTFRSVTIVEDVSGKIERNESGYAVDFQLKSSVNCVETEADIRYDCKAKAYNKIVNQNGLTGTTPCLLLVLCLPKSQNDWLTTTEKNLTVGGGCYWFYLTGVPTKKQKRLILPRTNLFTPDALQDIMERIQKGQRP